MSELATIPGTGTEPERRMHGGFGRSGRPIGDRLVGDTQDVAYKGQA